MAIARPIYSSMLSAHTDSDFFGIGNPKVSQLFGLVVLIEFFGAQEVLMCETVGIADWHSSLRQTAWLAVVPLPQSLPRQQHHSFVA
jgi:hypothetical protein